MQIQSSIAGPIIIGKTLPLLASDLFGAAIYSAGGTRVFDLRDQNVNFRFSRNKESSVLPQLFPHKRKFLCYGPVTPPTQKEAGRLVVTHEADPKQSTFIRERLKVMTLHVSASAQEETPHETERIQITISDALRRRAESVIHGGSIDPQWRNIIRYALEISDPLLPDLVRRADAGEKIIETTEFSTQESNEDDSNEEKVEALTEIICGAGDEATAALFVLMGALENSVHPKLLANAAKHFAFTRCAELNLYGMVDAQLPLVEGELLADSSLVS